MDTPVIEATYPLSFRVQEAEELGEKLRRRQSVDLIGMKRVGISNFLRFFLYHSSIVSKYISPEQTHLFIPVDLNDLVERELFPFWTLTLKRMVDTVNLSKLPEKVKEEVEGLFLESIQSQDLFVVIDNVRKAMGIIVARDVYPTLFFLRFDRMRDAVSPSFFDNLEGLRTSTQEKLCYVFTSYKGLNVLFPSVQEQVSLYSQLMYVRPATSRDMQSICATYKKRFGLLLSRSVEEALFDMIGGHVQYLQLALIILGEIKKKNISSRSRLFDAIVSDERIALQSEEIWDSLSGDEQRVLVKARNGGKISEEEKQTAAYLWHTGIIVERQGKRALFSPLFEYHVKSAADTESEDGKIDLSKKEFLLFSLLEAKMGEICDRDEIVEAVWPEYLEFGVSDWAIDRLVARVRTKLKQQKSKVKILTVRTRGYKLVAGIS